ncbi:hypothetical protein E4U42_004173 [Claviceps africana]|uniref:Spore coat protein SP96 n=1 Tax=Claviceps africana TaxID=83212 RepID=A0A8K0JHZ9_9HYPO|nr:hypothetical protein E4U42_004173 [Claviceps africana]
MKVTAALAILSAAGFAAAHMEMMAPPPLRSKFNKFSTNADFDMTSPMAPSGANFPCKGHLSVLGTPQARSVADWAAGQPQSLTITGGASHNGGSCQASLSFDSGKTWKAIHSWVGNCPGSGESKFQFTVPSDTPAGPALFAWTWFNQVGNREMYMNCASVTITGGGKKKRGSTQSLQSRPDMFVANVGKGCGTAEGSDVLFPDPGPDVDMNSKKTAPPTGSCAESKSPGGSLPAPAPAPKPDEGNKPVPDDGQPAAPSSSPSYKPASATAPSLNNSQISTPTPTTAVGSQKPQVVATTQTPELPAGNNGACTPGAFSCSFDSRSWQVCGGSRMWIKLGDCGSGETCKFNESNKTPYCIAQSA